MGFTEFEADLVFTVNCRTLYKDPVSENETRFNKCSRNELGRYSERIPTNSPRLGSIRAREAELQPG